MKNPKLRIKKETLHKLARAAAKLSRVTPVVVAIGAGGCNFSFTTDCPII